MGQGGQRQYSKRSRLLPFGMMALLLAAVAPAAIWMPVTVGSGPSGCSEQVANGGFEAGETPWNIEWGRIATPTTFLTTYAHGGQYGALMGGSDGADERLSQGVSLPTEPGGLMFSFWWARHTEENPGWGRDFMYVELYSEDGSTLIDRLFTFDNTSGIDDWVWNPIAMDIQEYAGQRVQLRFRVTTDLNLVTRFFIDDVSIQSGTTCSTPMATVTMTFTPTATPSSTPTPKARIYLPLILRGRG